MGAAELVFVLLPLPTFGVQPNPNAPPAAEVLRYAPDDSDVMVHLDVEPMLADNWSKVQGLPNHPAFKANPDVQSAVRQGIAQVEQMRMMAKATSGVDFITDMKSVTVFVPSLLREGEFLVSFRGNFPPDLLDRVASKMGAPTTKSNGKTTMPTPDGKLLAQVDTGTLLMGPAGLVKARTGVGKPRAPKGATWEAAVMCWKTLHSDADAKFDAEVTLDARDIVPMVTWGTSPEQALPITANVPDPAKMTDDHKRQAAERALHYMGLTANMPITDIKVDHVFIGSCTNGRIEDLRAAAAVARGRKVSAGVNAIVVPGSGLVKEQAEEEGLDKVFLEAGFEWRDPGCSMCLAMNADKLQEGERCASTSNRNFEGRQGRGGRTHLVSPAMAAAAAVTGHLTDWRTL